MAAAPLNMELLVNKYSTMVLRQAFFYLKDRSAAEDAAQEVFLRIFRRQPVLEDENSEKAYLLRVTINVCKDVLKSAWYRKTIAIPEGFNPASPELSPDAQAVQGDENAALFRAVLALPPIYKDVVLLFYYHDLSTANIAKVLHVPEVTVRTRLMRARQKLGDKLKGRV